MQVISTHCRVENWSRWHAEREEYMSRVPSGAKGLADCGLHSVPEVRFDGGRYLEEKSFLATQGI